MNLGVSNEYGKLHTVILGTANDSGGQRSLDETYDPKTKEYMRKGISPNERDMVPEMEAFAAILQKHNVNVLRPNNLNGVNQIFTRDICFVIDNKFIIPEILRERKDEQDAMQQYIDQIDPSAILDAPDGVRIEGGDVVVHNDYIFVGYSDEKDFYNYKTARTNEAGLNYIKENFPTKTVIGFQLKKSDYEAMENALHLDCCFQPLGLGHALIFEAGFKHEEDLATIYEIFGKQNLIRISRQEMYDMCCNIFSISPDLVVSERGFIRINEKLQSLGYTVEEIPYYQISKQEGLLRCSTLPLLRS
jgi:N-dimethylarginine dimethylaminohydrolase